MAENAGYFANCKVRREIKQCKLPCLRKIEACYRQMRSLISKPMSDSEVDKTADPSTCDSDAPQEAGNGGEEVWHSIAAKPEFRELLASKARFIVPMCIFFLVYYFALPLLVGLAPELMAKKVWGVVNVAYVFALSQFFMTWIVAIIYARVAGRFDRQAHGLVSEYKS